MTEPSDMSGFSSPTTSQGHGCFCCKPTALPSHGMINQQSTSLQDSATANLTKSLEACDPFLSHTHVYESSLAPLFQNVSLSTTGESRPQFYTPCDSSVEHPHSSGLAMRPTVQSNTTFTSSPFYGSPNSQVYLNHQDPSSTFVNFRTLQNRELGQKLTSSLYNETKSVLSSTSSDASMNADTQVPTVDSQGLNMSSTEKGCATDAMDLDSALDELGMLSSVTNSRKQYLVETRGQMSSLKREARLRSKSESSPNLTALGRPNGYRIVQLDKNFVTGVSSSMAQAPQDLEDMSSVFSSSPVKSLPSRLEYRNPEVLEDAASRRRKSVPRMSRLRKDRYRRTRCPYSIPNRQCHSMQEADFGPEYFDTCPKPFSPPASASSSIMDNLSVKLPERPIRAESKSNTSSPAKPCQEVRLVRSLSAEDLAPVRRRLENTLEFLAKDTSRTDENLDQMASRLTDLHMS